MTKFVIHDKITIVINKNELKNMPAKKLITRQKIIDTAFQIVQMDGMDSLNMRNLAKMCNCSTQPIYLSFKNAE